MEYIVNDPISDKSQIKFSFLDELNSEIVINAYDYDQFVNLMHGTFENNDVFIYNGQIYSLSEIIRELGWKNEF
jgi:hypothetical protein